MAGWQSGSLDTLKGSQMDSAYIVTFVVCAVGGAVANALGYWHGRRAQRAEVTKLSVALARQSVKTDEMSALAEKEHNQRVQVVECIAIIEKERNTWKEMAYRAGNGHSAAQAMLMREIVRLSDKARRAGLKNADISPQIKRVVSEYAETFAAPPEAKNNGRISVATPAPVGIESPEKSV